MGDLKVGDKIIVTSYIYDIPLDVVDKVGVVVEVEDMESCYFKYKVRVDNNLTIWANGIEYSKLMLELL